MHNRPPVALGARVAAGGLTLAVHGLLVLVLLLEDRDVRQPLTAARRLPGSWINLSSLPLPSPELALQTPRPPPRNPASPTVISPGTTATPGENATPQAADTSAAPSGIDWQAAAERLAARNAQGGDEQDTFSRAPQKMREPCQPRDSSFEWHPEEKKYGLLPLPYIIVAERCLVTLGYFSCSLGPLPEPDKHLFDDMQQGWTPDSSVPDPNFCD
jgi:hypothetical protein